jgi:serine protease AprX
MSRDNGGTHGQVRSSALWGTGNRGGDSRANALWGKGGRGFAALLLVLVATAVPLASAGKARKSRTVVQPPPTYVDPYLQAKAANTPDAPTKILIQSATGLDGTESALNYAESSNSSSDDVKVRDEFQFTGTIAVTLPAKYVPLIAQYYRGLIITPDSKIKLTGSLSSNQVWPTASGVRPLWSASTLDVANMPTIAIVDSGIDKAHPCFGGGSRIVQRQVLTTLSQSGSGEDSRGHGTFVAGVAACEAAGFAGAAPQAKLIDLDVMDDNGMARTSDVIAAAEWIYQNRLKHNIKVANFSLHSTTPSNFTKDPLDKAVEKLWFSGVTVVVAAGNYGKADGPSGVPFAPGNDPFVITVGALDLEGSVSVNKHEVPSWSAYGFTNDGFRKPEISAAGRYMIGPVSANATLKTAKPENVVSPTYMRLSGTSFAAPVVAGAAAQILARHPTWTPDMVKGALMARARFVPEEGLTGAAGVGEVNAARSAAMTVAPNANLALNRFVVKDPLGLKAPAFDAVTWTDAAKANASWDSVTWTDVTWTDLSWSLVTWSDVSWNDVTWSDVTWSDLLALEDVTWEDAAGAEVAPPTGDYLLTPEEEAAAAADPELNFNLG